MKYIAIAVVSFIAGIVFTFVTATNGDMNRDGELSIIDLSILASVINEQK